MPSGTYDFRMFGLPAQFIIQVFNLYSRRNEWFVQYDLEDGEAEATVFRMLPVITSRKASRSTGFTR